MNNDNRLRVMVIVALLLSVVCITVGYAAMSSTLDINGVTSVSSGTWKVKFANLTLPTKVNGGLVGEAVEKVAPTISDTSINGFDIEFNAPGDKTIYKFDVVNSGQLDAKIGTFTINSPVCTGSALNPVDKAADESLICGNFSYSLKYASDESSVGINNLLNYGQTKSMILTIEYNGSTLPTAKVHVSGMNISIIYVQN